MDNILSALAPSTKLADTYISTENDKPLGINKLSEVCDAFCIEILIKDTICDMIYSSLLHYVSYANITIVQNYKVIIMSATFQHYHSAKLSGDNYVSYILIKSKHAR